METNANSKCRYNKNKYSLTLKQEHGEALLNKRNNYCILGYSNL
jgi:hypothetical protein